MDNFYYNLSGGINQASTKTELGMNTKNIFWADSKNIEILKNKGIIRQKGNKIFQSLPNSENILAMKEIKSNAGSKLIIATDEGSLYIYDELSDFIKLDKTLNSTKVSFLEFLNGVIVYGDNDAMFYIRNNDNYEIFDCNLKNEDESPIYPEVVTSYKGRLWVAEGSTLYFSALGTFDDFESENDAGYINNFYTDTHDITALKTYKDYLAIYKEDEVYLLTGSNPGDFAITPFADKGAYSANSVITVNNKQYFFSSGIYSLQVGELNQVMLGSEITENIKEEFQSFDFKRKREIFAIDYKLKNQIWYFIPYRNDNYFHTIWINDIVNQAWYKRVLPQNITCACIFENYILTADNEGNIYREDISNTFNGEAIEFMWKSPFLGLGNPTIRKTIDEFYFILDETYENKFNFSVYKNFDSENHDDSEVIYSNNYENLLWYKENSSTEVHDTWPDDNENEGVWALSTESIYKAEISEANYSVQLCIEGNKPEHNAAVIGIQFKEIYNED